MNCPKCGGKIKVLDVRHPSISESLRRKICTVCGHIFYTVEYEARTDGAFMKYWSKSYRPTTFGKKK